MNDYELLKRTVVDSLIKSNFQTKHYKHFDYFLNVEQTKKRVIHFSEHPEEIATMAHLPFISFDITFNKFSFDNDEYKNFVKPKTRNITLPSHLDSILLKLYGGMLSNLYEKYITQNGIDDVVVAYRKNKSNITGAKEAFDFVWKSNEAWIIKGDFSHFFDNLDHKILRKRLCDVLEPYFGRKLPNDWDAVLKIVTKYRKVLRKQMEKSFCNDQLNKYNGEAYVKNFRQLKKFINNGTINVESKNRSGIPQGTAISAPLANVYMSNFDQRMVEIVNTCSGLYRRYSDDFVVIIPMSEMNFDGISSLKKEIIELSKNTLHLQIENEKTKLMRFKRIESRIYLENTSKIVNFDYLGFSFTGNTVYLRQKTMYKFVYKGKKLIRRFKRDKAEYRLASSDDYKLLKQQYVSRFSTNLGQKLASERLNNARKRVKTGMGIRGRKQLVLRTLISSPVPKQNMLFYAKMAQDKLSIPIEGEETLYKVKIISKIKKKISKFQTELN